MLGELITDPLPAEPAHAVTGSFSTLAVGPNHTCVVGSVTGDVKCWGLNQFGEVGNGKRFHETPQRVVPAL